MIGYVVAGLVTGGIYAISAIAMVTTYNASRVFNFGQAGIAFFIAYIYYWLTTTVGVAPVPAAVLCVVVVGPVLGVTLWALLLDRLGRASQRVRVAGTIGLQLALTALTILIFGRQEVLSVPNLLGEPTTVTTVAGVRISNDQLLVMGSAVVVAVAASFVLQRTNIGLVTRGAVDSRLMTSLTGTNPGLVTAATWAVGSSIAGLAGILLASQVSLDSVSISAMVVTSYAAVVVGKLTNLWRAFFGALVIGVLQSVLLPVVPSDGLLSTALRPSVPFVMLACALIVYSWRGEMRSDGRHAESASAQSAIEQKEAHLATLMRGAAGRWDRRVGWAVLVVIIVGYPMLATPTWIGFVALGLTYSLAFLSYRLVTGELGVISLGQIAFAGIGAIATGQFMLNGWSFWPSAGMGMIIAAAAGTVLGVVCLKLSDLYAAIATFAFVMLVAEVVYTMPRFNNFDSGVFVDRPVLFGYYFGSDESFYVLMVGLLAVVMWCLARLRRSTAGLAFSTMLASRVRAETLGISTFGARVAAYAAGAALASLGGAMIASYQMVALPKAFLPVVGLTWFAAAIAQGARSMGGLVFAGILLAVMPQVFELFLPRSLAEMPPLLFGLLAILLVSRPAGINVHLRGSMREIAVKIERSRARGDSSGTDHYDTAPAARENRYPVDVEDKQGDLV
ncbi:hypothetical protein GCM10023094_11730 [Rhodococcus olei]|uniref:Branched-chain amino acid transport system permease protein n=1 Tax=Rhodococcus olei TaxID=2161675 RepID=A0ABP8NYM0_9NOCA